MAIVGASRDEQRVYETGGWARARVLDEEDRGVRARIADAAASTLGGPTVAPADPTVAPAPPTVARGALRLVAVSPRDPSVGRVGLEPTTVGLKARCSTN